MGNKQTVSLIKETSWRADWSGPFSLLEVSTSPRIYSNGLKDAFGKSFSSFLVIYKKGVASAYLPEEEYQKLGKYFWKKMEKMSDAKKVADNFIRLADKIDKIVNLPPKKFLESLEPNRVLYEEYGAHNVAIKIAVDVAGDGMDEKIREVLAKSRRYSEKFYKNNAKAFARSIKFLKGRTDYSEEGIFMMTRDELLGYLQDGKMPTENRLLSRNNCCGFFSSQDGPKFLSRKEVSEIEKSWTRSKGNILKGKSAYPGKVRGKCRVVMDYKNVSFEKGDILVTGMTDPDYVFLMKRSSAIVTDGGGILSHAAIVARELKKPCVIGTKIATKVLKDGDRVEVDADEGVVRIIK